MYMNKIIVAGLCAVNAVEASSFFSWIEGMFEDEEAPNVSPNVTVPVENSQSRPQQNQSSSATITDTAPQVSNAASGRRRPGSPVLDYVESLKAQIRELQRQRGAPERLAHTEAELELILEVERELEAKRIMEKENEALRVAQTLRQQLAETKQQKREKERRQKEEQDRAAAVRVKEMKKMLQKSRAEKRSLNSAISKLEREIETAISKLEREIEQTETDPVVTAELNEIRQLQSKIQDIRNKRRQFQSERESNSHTIQVVDQSSSDDQPLEGHSKSSLQLILKIEQNEWVRERLEQETEDLNQARTLRQLRQKEREQRDRDARKVKELADARKRDLLAVLDKTRAERRQVQRENNQGRALSSLGQSETSQERAQKDAENWRNQPCVPAGCVPLPSTGTSFVELESGNRARNQNRNQSSQASVIRSDEIELELAQLENSPVPSYIDTLRQQITSLQTDESVPQAQSEAPKTQEELNILAELERDRIEIETLKKEQEDLADQRNRLKATEQRQLYIKSMNRQRKNEQRQLEKTLRNKLKDVRDERIAVQKKVNNERAKADQPLGPLDFELELDRQEEQERQQIRDAAAKRREARKQKLVECVVW
eukprot:gene723-562_t